MRKVAADPDIFFHCQHCKAALVANRSAAGMNLACQKCGQQTLVPQPVEPNARRGIEDFGTALGRYVIMPDHIHLFVSGDFEFVLSKWVTGLKRVISKGLCVSGQFWQPTFFDHVLRSEESDSEKWEYVRQNPVRAGLVKESDDWPYQGESVVIDRV